MKLVSSGSDILESSPPGQRSAARSVLNGKGVSIITNGTVRSAPPPPPPRRATGAALRTQVDAFCRAFYHRLTIGAAGSDGMGGGQVASIKRVGGAAAPDSAPRMVYLKMPDGSQQVPLASLQQSRMPPSPRRRPECAAPGGGRCRAVARSLRARGAPAGVPKPDVLTPCGCRSCCKRTWCSGPPDHSRLPRTLAGTAPGILATFRCHSP